MNWIDFNILCVGQLHSAIYENEIYNIEVMNHYPNKSIKCYIECWDIVNRIQGIWYELWSSDEKYDYIINSTWELNKDKEKLNSACGYRLFIEDDYRQLFLDLFGFYARQSPVNKIIVLFRHQGHESERIENCMSVKTFVDKLVNKDIYGNIAYILSN